MEGETDALPFGSSEHALPHCKAPLAANIHLHEVNSARLDQVLKRRLIGFVFPRSQW